MKARKNAKMNEIHKMNMWLNTDMCGPCLLVPPMFVPLAIPAPPLMAAPQLPCGSVLPPVPAGVAVPALENHSADSEVLRSQEHSDEENMKASSNVSDDFSTVAASTASSASSDDDEQLPSQASLAGLAVHHALPALPSRGSVLHGTGKCRPCGWFWKKGGCSNGRDCLHCHACPEDEMKSRKQVKAAAMRSGALQPLRSAADSRMPRAVKLMPLL